jgi:hypothetical protein
MQGLDYPTALKRPGPEPSLSVFPSHSFFHFETNLLIHLVTISFFGHSSILSTTPQHLKPIPSIFLVIFNSPFLSDLYIFHFSPLLSTLSHDTFVSLAPFELLSTPSSR